jgi:hypothetical protein
MLDAARVGPDQIRLERLDHLGHCSPPAPEARLPHADQPIVVLL